jgi:hypothetical protein
MTIEYGDEMLEATAKLYVANRLIDSLTFDTKDTIRLSSTKQKPAKLKIISKNHYPLTIKIKEQGCYNVDAKLLGFLSSKIMIHENTYKIIRFDEKLMKLEKSNSLYGRKKIQNSYVKYNSE